jgi:hypothetical protein
MTDPHKASTDEELRLVNSHLRSCMAQTAALARNSIRTNSKDPEDWRADVQMLAEKLERMLAS